MLLRTICNYIDSMCDPAKPILGVRSRVMKVSPILCAMVCLLGLRAQSQEPLRIATTFFPIFSLTASVVGPHARIENLLPAAVGPHEFQLSPQDLRKLSQANLIVMNGLELESWMEEALGKTSAASPKTVVRFSDGIRGQLIAESGSHRHGRLGEPDSHTHTLVDEKTTGINPHIWLDPTLAAHGVSNLVSILERMDPKNTAAYRENAKALVRRLEQLDLDYRKRLAPLRESAFITYHQAFPYLIRRYGLRLAGVLEEVPDVEPSARHLADLARVIREQKVKVIFVEPLSSPKLAQQLAKDCGIKVAELDTLETGPLTSTGYEDKMRRNLTLLVEGLR